MPRFSLLLLLAAGCDDLLHPSAGVDIDDDAALPAEDPSRVDSDDVARGRSGGEPVLEALGMVPDDSDPPHGDAHPLDSDRPLAVFGKRELLLRGFGAHDGVVDVFPSYLTPANLLLGGWNASGLGPDLADVDGVDVGAQLDDDGPQEVVTAWFGLSGLHLRVLDTDLGAPSAWQTRTSTVMVGAYAPSLDVDAVDLDGDGLDELVVAGCAVTSCHLLTLASRSDDGWVLLDQREYDARDLRVAMGGLLSGGGLGLAVAVTPVDPDAHLELQVLTPTLDEEQSLELRGADDRGRALVIGGADVAVADVDLDGRDDVVVGAHASSLSHTTHNLVVVSNLDGRFQAGAPAVDKRDHFGDGAILHPLEQSRVAVARSVRGAPSVAVNDVLFRFDGEGWQARMGLSAEAQWEACERGDQDAERITRRDDFALIAADIDGRPGDELLFRVRGGCSIGVMAEALGTSIMLPTRAIATPKNSSPAMGSVDIDPDELVLEFSHHSFKVTDASVMALLTAPPCTEAQSPCSTTLGSGTASNDSVSNAVTMKASVYLGVEVAVQALFTTVGKFSMRHTISMALQSKTAWSTSESQTLSDTTGPREEAVVFGFAPYDLYHYRVVGGRGDAYDQLVDQSGSDVPELVVGIPRAPRVSRMSLDTFNELVPPSARVYPPHAHVPGDPDSYPTHDEVMTAVWDDIDALTELAVEEVGEDQAEELAGALPLPLESDTYDVGEGAGSRTVSLSYTEAQVTTTTFTVGMEFSAGAVVGPAAAGFSLGVSDSVSVSHGTSTTTTAGFSVGNVDDPADTYGIGMVMYPHVDGDRFFHVIEYWVD